MHKYRRAYEQAYQQEGKAWWCRKKEEKSPDNHKTEATRDVISWRIGWSCCARKGFSDKEGELLSFFRSIDSEKEWIRGKGKGVEQALLTETDRDKNMRFPDYLVIDFRHAAWLLGWFEGFLETQCVDVWRHSCGTGSDKGRTAAKFYRRLLYEKWSFNDREMEDLLGIIDAD